MMIGDDSDGYEAPVLLDKVYTEDTTPIMMMTMMTFQMNMLMMMTNIDIDIIIDTHEKNIPNRLMLIWMIPKIGRQ